MCDKCAKDRESVHGRNDVIKLEIKEVGMGFSGRSVRYHLGSLWIHLTSSGACVLLLIPTGNAAVSSRSD